MVAWKTKSWHCSKQISRYTASQILPTLKDLAPNTESSTELIYQKLYNCNTSQWLTVYWFCNLIGLKLLKGHLFWPFSICKPTSLVSDPWPIRTLFVWEPLFLIKFSYQRSLSFYQVETITENQNCTQCRNQQFIVSPAPVGIPLPWLLHLRLKEHQRRGNRKFVRARIPGSLL